MNSQPARNRRSSSGWQGSFTSRDHSLHPGNKAQHARSKFLSRDRESSFDFLSEEDEPYMGSSECDDHGLSIDIPQSPSAPTRNRNIEYESNHSGDDDSKNGSRSTPSQKTGTSKPEIPDLTAGSCAKETEDQYTRKGNGNILTGERPRPNDGAPESTFSEGEEQERQDGQKLHCRTKAPIPASPDTSKIVSSAQQNQYLSQPIVAPLTSLNRSDTIWRDAEQRAANRGPASQKQSVTTNQSVEEDIWRDKHRTTDGISFQAPESSAFTEPIDSETGQYYTPTGGLPNDQSIPSTENRATAKCSQLPVLKPERFPSFNGQFSTPDAKERREDRRASLQDQDIFRIKRNQGDPEQAWGTVQAPITVPRPVHISTDREGSEAIGNAPLSHLSGQPRLEPSPSGPRTGMTIPRRFSSFNHSATENDMDARRKSRRASLQESKRLIF